MRLRARSYVWCDHHCAIHPAEPDYYKEGPEGQADCQRANWRKVYVQTSDPEEEF